MKPFLSKLLTPTILVDGLPELVTTKSPPTTTARNHVFVIMLRKLDRPIGERTFGVRSIVYRARQKK